MRFNLYLIPIFLFVLINSCNFSTDEEYQKKCGGIISFSETESFQNFNVHTVNNPSSERVLSQLFEGLVKFHAKELSVVPCLAKSFSYSAENLSYTFILKDNIYFHDNVCFSNGDGRKVSAQDIVYSFERICNKKVNSPAYVSVFKNIVKGAETFYKGKSKNISGISTTENSITIQLITPHPSFLEKLASINCAIVPKEGVELYGNNNTIGTGPFYLSKNLDNEKMVLLKNQKYHGVDEKNHQLPFLDSVVVYFETSAKGSLENYTKGLQNIMINIPSDYVETALEKIKKENKTKPIINNSALLASTILEFNTLNPFLSNVHLRKAINYAIDKNALANIVFGPVHEKVGEMGIGHPAIFQYSPDRVNGYVFDLEKAKQELQLSGLSDSLHLLSFVFSVNNNDFKSLQIAEEIIFQLKNNLGVELKLNLLNSEFKSEMIKYGRSEISLNTIQAKFSSPEAFLIYYYGRDVSSTINEPSYPNTSRYQNDKFDFSFERGRKSSNVEEAYRNFLIAENQLMEDAPLCVLWYENYNCIYHTKVKNFYTNPLSYMDLSEVYLEKK